MRINYGQSVHGKEEIEAVVKVLKTSTRMGVNVKNLEIKVAKLFGKKYSLMVNSGSSALLLLAEILNIKKGDEFITPVLTFPTSISPFLQKGMIAKFVDINLQTLQIDENLIKKYINKKTKFIIVPNLIGNIANWKIINKIARKFKLITIEDSADTIGGTIGGRSSGIFSDYSITSFYGSHIINCAGNGGALAINDDKVMERAKLLRSWGRSSSLFDDQSEKIENRFNVKLEGIDYDAKFVFEKVGYNLEGNEVGAAFGLAQLKKLKNNIKIRQKNFKRQCDFFSKYPDCFSNPIETKGCKTAWLAFPLLIKEKAPFNRREMQIYLEKRNIQTRVVLTGNILRQPMCKGMNFRVVDGGCPNADQVMKSSVLLPVHHGLTEEMFKRFHSTIQEFI